ncbi:aminopeptidase P1 [Wolffia australiana]
MEDSLDALRALMASRSPPLDALIVPSEDSHQSEYVSARDQRRVFISGFTGSAGLALVTQNGAYLWTDGRYFLQASKQLSDRWKLMRSGEDPAVETWISDNLPRDAAIGVNPWCVSVDTARRWESVFIKKRQKLVQLANDLVDEVWKDRPAEEILPVSVQPLEFSGRSVSEKIRNLRGRLSQEKAYAIVITALDEVAWLYNIRGNDVAYCPVVHAYAIVTADSSFLYVDQRKLPNEVVDHLTDNGITIRGYSDVESDIVLLASGQSLNSKTRHSIGESNATGSDDQGHTGAARLIENDDEKRKQHAVWIDPSSCCFVLYSKFASDKILLLPSPLSLSKALKNDVELSGLRKAHERDGAAVVQFLSWLDNQMQQIYGASGYFLESEGAKKKNNSVKLTEVSVSDRLEEFRSKQEHFKGLSFPTISGVGPNAAIIHYKPQLETCSELDPDSIYLFDSGAQYRDGTTDVTRTVHFGKPSAHEKACYTAVLKGHIALDVATFPNGTTGHSLDVLARTPLWKRGLDYRHGTGHGVGSYLLVHEGPHLISFRPYAGNVALQASMTVTDEPGYYEDGNFGIRLENVLIVKEASTDFDFGGKGYLSFEHITWVPFQNKLIDSAALTPDEIRWVDDYHSTCRKILAPYLNAEENRWLERATVPLQVDENL